MSKDAIVILREDHKEVRALFREFENKSTTKSRKGSIVRKAIELLTVHTYIENEVMYPEVRRLLTSRTTCWSRTRSTTSLTSWSWNCRRWSRMTRGSRRRPRC